MGKASATAARDHLTRVAIHRRTDDGNAFMPDPQDGPAHVDDEFAETLAESYIKGATLGHDVLDDELHREEPEEIGGPFMEVPAGREFAMGTDASNPEDAAVEPLPLAMEDTKSFKEYGG